MRAAILPRSRQARIHSPSCRACKSRLPCAPARVAAYLSADTRARAWVGKNGSLCGVCRRKTRSHLLKAFLSTIFILNQSLEQRERLETFSVTFSLPRSLRRPTPGSPAFVEVPSLCHLRKVRARGAELRPGCGDTPSSEVLTARQRSSQRDRGPCTAQRSSPARCIYLVATIEPPLFLSRSLCGCHFLLHEHCQGALGGVPCVRTCCGGASVRTSVRTSR